MIVLYSLLHDAPIPASPAMGIPIPQRLHSFTALASAVSMSLRFIVSSTIFLVPLLVALTVSAQTPATRVMPGVAAKSEPRSPRPHPVNNPQSHVMLTGDWMPSDPHQIDFDRLPRVPVQHVVVSDAGDRNGVNQHNYLIHHDGQFWAMWSDGPAIEDRVGQVVKYATSNDGLKWTEPKFMTPYPRNSGPDSPNYNTRKKEGFRYISRGFWLREGQL